MTTVEPCYCCAAPTENQDSVCNDCWAAAWFFAEQNKPQRLVGLRFSVLDPAWRWSVWMARAIWIRTVKYL